MCGHVEGRSHHASFLTHFSTLRHSVSLNLKLKDLSGLAEQQAPRTSSYCSLAEGLQAHVWFFTECWGPELSPASTSVRKPSPQPLAKHILPKYFLYKASQEARRRHCCYCLPGLPNTWHLNATTYWFSPDSNSFSNKINVKK